MDKRIGKKKYVLQGDKLWSEKKPPKILYKYYSLCDNSLDALEKKYLYAANPKEENDLYDSSPLIINLRDSKGVKPFIEKHGFLWIDDIHKDSILNPNYQNLAEAVFSNWRIISFIPNYRNELMWAHYAHNNGFCVGIDISKLGFKHQGIFHVQYQDLEPVVINTNQSALIPYIMCLQKSLAWEYEDEWRCLVNANGEKECKCEYCKKNPIHSIHVGYSFFDMTRRADVNRYYFDNVKKDNKGDEMLEYKIRLLRYIKDNNVPFYINYALRLGKFRFKKCEIKEVNEQGKYIQIKNISS